MLVGVSVVSQAVFQKLVIWLRRHFADVGKMFEQCNRMPEQVQYTAQVLLFQYVSFIAMMSFKIVHLSQETRCHFFKLIVFAVTTYLPNIYCFHLSMKTLFRPPVSECEQTLEAVENFWTPLDKVSVREQLVANKQTAVANSCFSMESTTNSLENTSLIGSEIMRSLYYCTQILVQVTRSTLGNLKCDCRHPFFFQVKI